MAGEDAVDRLANRAHRRVVEGGLGIDRRIAGGEQERVPISQRHVEVFGEVQEQFAARLRAAGLHEGEVARRHLGFGRQVELAESAPLPPFAQQRSDLTGRGHEAYGRDGLEALYAQVHTNFPGYVFGRVGEVERLQRWMRFSWDFRGEDGTLLAAGTDIGEIVDGSSRGSSASMTT